MADQDFLSLFREQLRLAARSHKYAPQIKPGDLERAVRAFEVTLQNPSISDTLLFEMLTGERV